MRGEKLASGVLTHFPHVASGLLPCKPWNALGKTGWYGGRGVGLTNLSKGWSAATESNTAGKAAETGRYSAAKKGEGVVITEGSIVPGEPITDPKIRGECWDTWVKSDLGSMRAHEEGFASSARFHNGQRVFSDPVAADPSITLADAQRLQETPALRRMPTLTEGASQYVNVHSHPFPEGTELYVKDGVTYRAGNGPSTYDVLSNQIQRDLGRNVVDYVLSPAGIYRVVGTQVERIAPISYIHPGNR